MSFGGDTTSAESGSGAGTAVGGAGGDGQGPSTSASTTAAGTGGAGGTGAGGTGTGAGGAASGGAGPIDPGTIDCSPPEGEPAPLKLTPYAQLFVDPVLATAPRNAPAGWLWVVEQRGTIMLTKGGQDNTVFLDLEDVVECCGERGLLGLAFHPDYQDNGRFFVHYSGAGNVTTVREYRRDPDDPESADPEPVGPAYLTLAQPYANHNGGSLEFGVADGMLYLGLGDGGSSNDPQNHGQNTFTWLGALLRIDVSQNPYTIPAGNLPRDKGLPEIFDWGLRNPYRFNFDPCTGDRYIGDVGQGQREEIDVAAPDDTNVNWGWRRKEGTRCHIPNVPSCDPIGELRDPVAEYDHSGGKCSVTGGHVYRGSNIPWLRGTYIYGDYCSGDTWLLRWQPGGRTQIRSLTSQIGSDAYMISSFAMDAAGEIYLLDWGTYGVVYRLDPADADDG